MGNSVARSQSRERPRKKNVHWKTAEPPSSPGKPILVSAASDTPDVVTIRWDRPKADGGAPILGYLVEHRRTGSPHWVRAFPNLVPATELSLSGLEPGWRYQFRITAENVVGKSEASEISDPLTVTLQRNAITAPRFALELCDTVAIENEKVEFQVTVTGTPSPEVNWFKDGFEIFSSRRTKILTDNNTSTLTFHETALTDEGEIKCTATNRAGHAVAKGQLRVEAPPKIRLPRNYEDGLIVEADEAIKLKVGIAGRPTPVVCWTHNGEAIDPDDRIEIETTEKNSSLRVLHGRREDRGEYNVRAVNKLGEDNGSVLVTVTARPSPPGRVTVAISLGKSVTLSWNAPDDDGGCKIGNYTVEYFRIGWNMWLKATTTRSLSATLSELIEGSEYKFRVKAENPYGMSDPSEESSILFIPDPKRGILRPTDTPTEQSVLMENNNKPSAPRRRRMSPMSSSNHSLEDGGMVTTADKGEQTHMARLRIQKSTVNVQLIPEVFDSDTIARHMSYGSPDPQKNKEKSPAKELNKQSRDRSPIPGRDLIVSTTTVNTLMLQPDLSPLRSRSKSPTPVNVERAAVQSQTPVKVSTTYVEEITIKREVSPLPIRREVPLSPAKSMPLPPPQMESSGDKPFDFEFDDDDLLLPPPPLSLSAPELSAEPPSVPVLKRSVSSTELLYEKAMARFYKAMELDEREQSQPKSGRTSAMRGASVEVETIGRAGSTGSGGIAMGVMRRRDSVGSMERGLERKSSLRRRLSGEIPDVNINFSRPRSLSKESVIRQQSPAEVSSPPQRNTLYPQESLDDPDYFSHVDDYTDYTESTASSDESETEKFKRRVREHGQPKRSITDTDLDTYHPLNRMGSPYASPDSDQAAEVLTKPFSLPSPDFVPKPILKRPSLTEEESDDKKTKGGKKSTKNQRKTFGKLFERKASNEEVVKTSPSGENLNKEVKKETKSETNIGIIGTTGTTGEIGGPRRSSLEAKEKAKQLKMEMRQSSIEEEKVAIDHYSDLVREKSHWRSAPVPLYLNADELKRAAAEEFVDDELEDEMNVQGQQMTYHDNTPLMSPSTRVLVDKSKVPSRPMNGGEKITSSDLVKRFPQNKDELDAPSEEIEPVEQARSRGGSRNSSAVRRVSKTPVEARVASKSRERSTSKSPLTINRRPLNVAATVREENRDNRRTDSVQSRRTPTPCRSRPMTPQEELQQQQDIDVKVKGTISYTTDVVLFFVACWVYLFKDARLAMPIVLLLVYRHIRDHLPGWMVKRTN